MNCLDSLEIEKTKFENNKLRFQYIGSFLRNKNAQITIFNVDDNCKISNSEKAECLAKQFESTFVHHTLIPPKYFQILIIK